MFDGVRGVAAVVAGVVMLAACGPQLGEQPTVEEGESGSGVEPGVELVADVERAEPDGAQVDGLVRGMWQFADGLMAEAAEPEENVVVSPLSIATAFGMARAGADGQTAEEIDAVFGFDADDAVTHASFNALDRHLDEAAPGEIGDLPDEDAEDAEADDGGEVPPVLAVANGVFPQDGFPVHDQYLQTLMAEYGSGVVPVDFADPATVDVVNGWVAEHTAGRIDELFDDFDGNTVMVLANAIYFNADWDVPFTDDPGSDGTYTTADGAETTAVMMRQVFSQVDFAQGDGWQAVALPYEDQSLAMWVIVPEGDATPADVLTAETFQDVGDTLQEGVVELAMPQWDFDYDLPLIEPLEQMGMQAPFGDADFSGITDADIWIDDAIHSATTTVDEWGTEAAAATALEMPVSEGPEPDAVIEADRPFAFAIVDTTHHTPIFVGQVTDPST